ncbi:hypothetical protein BC940DRAFT_310546 [Gongronella butleri]|nr:hypothetical protein BC940DRAFT_310546 [Gongronella butleri]
MQQVQSQYTKALRYFVLTKYGLAASTCVKAMASFKHHVPPAQAHAIRQQLLTLYLNIAATSIDASALEAAVSPRLAKQFGLTLADATPEAFVQGLWAQIVQCYADHAGDVDAALVSAYLLVSIKWHVPAVGRQVAEEWFASVPDATLDRLANASAEDRQAYIDCVRVYTCRILTQTADYASAKSFIEYNGILGDDDKKVLYETVDEAEANEQKEAEQRRLVEQQRREAENAARALAEKRKAEQLAAAQEAERQQQEALVREKEEAQRQQALQQEKQENQQNQQNAMNEPASSPVPRGAPSSSSSATTNGGPLLGPQPQLTMIKTWMHQLRTTGSAAYVAILLVLFALVGLLRGPRSQVTRAVRLVMMKLWQTIQMGTKVTYL